jgi:hypothetical protein
MPARDSGSGMGGERAPEDEVWSPDSRRRMLLSRFTPDEIKRLFGDEAATLEAAITPEAEKLIRTRFTPDEIEFLFGNEGAALGADVTPEMDAFHHEWARQSLLDSGFDPKLVA